MFLNFSVCLILIILIGQCAFTVDITFNDHVMMNGGSHILVNDLFITLLIFDNLAGKKFHFDSTVLVDEDKLAMPEFEALWSRINAKSVYVVDFDTEELIQKSITSLDSKLRVSKIHFQVETGIMDTIKSKEELLSGTSFVKEEFASYGVTMAANSNVFVFTSSSAAKSRSLAES